MLLRLQAPFFAFCLVSISFFSTHAVFAEDRTQATLEIAPAPSIDPPVVQDPVKLEQAVELPSSPQQESQASNPIPASTDDDVGASGSQPIADQEVTAAVPGSPPEDKSVTDAPGLTENAGSQTPDSSPSGSDTSTEQMDQVQSNDGVKAGNDNEGAESAEVKNTERAGTAEDSGLSEPNATKAEQQAAPEKVSEKLAQTIPKKSEADEASDNMNEKQSQETPADPDGSATSVQNTAEPADKNEAANETTSPATNMTSQSKETPGSQEPEMSKPAEKVVQPAPNTTADAVKSENKSEKPDDLSEPLTLPKASATPKSNPASDATTKPKEEASTEPPSLPERKPEVPKKVVKHGCERRAFEVNDFGKKGPINYARQDLAKYVEKIKAREGVKDVRVSEKAPTCKLFLWLGPASEYTCRIEATMCW